jgi:hypothetical protein
VPQKAASLPGFDPAIHRFAFAKKMDLGSSLRVTHKGASLPVSATCDAAVLTPAVFDFTAVLRLHRKSR